MKQFVIIYDNTIIVRMQAIRSASLSVLPVFSPSDLAQSLQIRLMVTFSIKHTIEQKILFSIVDYAVEGTIWD